MGKAKPKEESIAPVFEAADLIAAHYFFGVLPEVVAGALQGKEKATTAETKALITAYLETPKDTKGAN